MSPALISSDGRWWWDGSTWRSRLIEGDLDLFWFTSTPDWFSRVLVTGLIALIPIVGAINLLGWTLVATDMVRQRWRELPPAGFQYLERGVAPFLVTFVYGIAVLVVLATFFLTGLVLLFTFKAPNVVIGLLLILVAILLGIAWWLLSLYLSAAILIGSDRLGAAAAMNPMRLFALAGANRDVSLSVALTYGAASLLLVVVSSITGFLGLIAYPVLPAIYAMVTPKLAAFKVDGYTQR